MGKHRDVLAPILLIVVICTILFCILINCFQQIEYEKLNIVILIGTFLVVAWYTTETHLMRLAAKEQIDLSVLPAIAINNVDSESDTFEITNIGNGVAINIKIEDVVLNKMPDHRLKFIAPLCLKSKRGHGARHQLMPTYELI